jgi:hypothetical protein
MEMTESPPKTNALPSRRIDIQKPCIRPQFQKTRVMLPGGVRSAFDGRKRIQFFNRLQKRPNSHKGLRPKTLTVAQLHLLKEG